MAITMLAAALKRVPVGGGGSLRFAEGARSASAAGWVLGAAPSGSGLGTSASMGALGRVPIWRNEEKNFESGTSDCDSFFFFFFRFARVCFRVEIARLPPGPLLSTTSMINWKKLDAWRGNPLLTHTMRASAPGLLLGAGAFAVYVAYDKATATRKEGEGGHH